MVKRVVFGKIANDGVASLQDINLREGIVLGTLAVAVLWLGLWPAPLTDVMHSTVQNLLEHIAKSKLGA
ncbi:MAG: hypothetical protein M1283_03695 [Gammaproteobacteria bacterium]|nr:hypothetical protein [Gammaproteobacteria bacterium]